MRTLNRVVPGVVALSLLGLPVASATAEVRIVSPDPTSAVFDEVRVVVEIADPRPLASIDLRVDGSLFSVPTRPPHQRTVDVGSENRQHEFVVLVRFEDGSQLEDRVTTPAVHIDMELDLSLEQVYVTATVEDLPILDLTMEEFRLLEDGQAQPLVTFERGDIPMTLAFLVDASESMIGEHLEGAVTAARGFLSRLNPLDEASLMVFSDRLHHLTEPSMIPGRIDAALDDLEPGGGTALNDFLYTALRSLDSRQGRPVVILLSDGVDTLSFLNTEELLWKVRRSDAVIYRVQLQESAARGLGYATVWRDMTEQKATVDGLDRAVMASGGRVQILLDVEELPAALDGILQELRQQYVLGYYAPAQGEEARYRSIDIEVTRPGVQIRSRSGVVR